MELRTLKYFTAVAESLSFSVAAEKLGLSQSAVSRQVQLLEQELGVRLFDRVGRKVRMTPAGRELMEPSYQVQNVVASLTSRAREMSTGAHGMIRVGATPQTLESLLAPLLPRFQQRHPEVRFLLVEDGSANLADGVERGNIDVAVCALDKERNLKSQTLFPLVALAALPRNHPFRFRKSLEVSQLADEQLLLLRKDFMTRTLFDGACQIAHITPRVLIESASPQCLLTLVQGGLGIAVVPSTLRLGRGHPPVVPLTQNGRQLGRWMQALWDPRRYASPLVQQFIEELVAFTRSDYPGKSYRIKAMLASRAAPFERRVK
jgi:DNA-binding transcriptional LysR family regulator